MIFNAAAFTDPGPRKSNEDAVAFWSVDGSGLFAAIADGLGGMGGGADASSIAIDSFRNVDCGLLSSEPDLRSLAESAHRNIVAGQAKDPALKNMASTLTAGLFTSNLLRGVHCGDTRVAIARANGVKRLTTDHSEGQRLFAAGKLTKDELIDYPRKNILDSALGARSEPQIDTFTFELLPRDKVFFTSDGVHGKVMLREVRDIAAQHENPEQFILELKDLVNSRVPDDNFSILAVFVE